MLADQFTAAAQAARNTHDVDEIARLTILANAEGQLSDADAVAIGEALQGRRAAFAVGQAFGSRRGRMAVLGLPRASRGPPRSPDRQASLERRRRQAMSGIVPAKIAAAFTMAELAVLTVIGRQIQRGGTCSLHIDAIAALAGCCRSTVKNALRQARLLGLVTVKERRIPGRKSLTNVISIISREWLAWQKLAGAAHPRTIGVKKLTATDNHFYPRGETARIVPRGGGSRAVSLGRDGR